MQDEHPYLVAMITYSRLAARVWRLVDYFEPAIVRDFKRNEYEALEGEINQWYETVPDEIKISNFSGLPLWLRPPDNLQRLQIWTRLRLNQIRIWLLTPVLHSASSIHDNMPLAERVVDVAKETIQYLSQLHSHTDLYRRIQIFYHMFLTSSIAVLFLASTHAPLQFSSSCRNEFYMALELVKDMSAKSWVSQRIWKTVLSLKAYAPKVGLLQDPQPPSPLPPSMQLSQPMSCIEPAATLIVTDAATAASPTGGNMPPGQPFAPPPVPPHLPYSASASPTPYAAFSMPPRQQQQQQQHQQQQPQPHLQDNGLRLHSEMTNIFEGYMGKPTARPGRAVGYANGGAALARIDRHESDESDESDDGFFQQFRAMF